MPPSGLATLEALPPEFSDYDQAPRQLPVGEVGKSGVVVLEFERDPATGMTVATEMFSKVPLQVQKVIYLGDSPGMAYVYVMSPSGGILQGDRLRIDVGLRGGAQVHVTTQAATKVYSMERNYAVQEVSLDVGAGCYLELVPDQIIPYRRSRFHQLVRARVHDRATMVYSEVVAPGRTGEMFVYDICSLKTVCLDQRSKLRFVDSLLLEPGRLSPGELLGAGTPVFGSIYAVTGALDARRLSDLVHDALEAGPAEGGASVLPGRDGVFARMVAATAGEAKRSVDLVVAALRREILGVGFGGTRKY